MKVGIVTLTWDKFKRDAPDEWPEERVLREVKEAGFDAVSMGPKSDQSPQEFLDYLNGFGLKPAPGYMGAEFWVPEKRDEQVNAARLRAKTAQSIGLTEHFVAPSGGGYVSRASGKTRSELAGHVGPDDGLSDEEYHVMAETLNLVGRAMLEEGVKACFHNHVGLAIETREETEKLFALVDPEAVFLGPDVGHMERAGADAADFVKTHIARIKALHLKDVDADVRDQVRQEEWDYNTGSAHGIWTELGQGCVNWTSIFQTLRESGYDGWLLSEIDVTQKPTPLQSATECREFLKSQGI